MNSVLLGKTARSCNLVIFFYLFKRDCHEENYILLHSCKMLTDLEFFMYLLVINYHLDSGKVYSAKFISFFIQIISSFQ
jgi:lantibiotic modifying enzyme